MPAPPPTSAKAEPSLLGIDNKLPKDARSQLIEYIFFKMVRSAIGQTGTPMYSRALLWRDLEKSSAWIRGVLHECYEEALAQYNEACPKTWDEHTRGWARPGLHRVRAELTTKYEEMKHGKMDEVPTGVAQKARLGRPRKIQYKPTE